MNVAIIGTGQIGKDLLCKLLKLNYIKSVAFVGRRIVTKKELPKIREIDYNKIIFSDQSIEYFIKNYNSCTIVFDCTDAYSAIINNKIFIQQNITVIDLTPSNIGKMYIPNIIPVNNKCVNMVTCGAQSSLPIIKYLKDKLNNIEYIEVVTQISASSAGMATRINIDKYIETTQKAITYITDIENNKVILILNPSPNANMKTTIYIRTPCNNDFIDFDDYVCNIKKYITQYSITKPTKISPNILSTHINIIGNGDYLSVSHGNLDVINCAAIEALNELYNYNI
jgi:acetaldehyde dehydrogenase